MLKELKEVLIDDFWIMPATPKYTSEGIPYITSKNIKNGKIDFENINYINIEDYQKISKNRPILIDDILISMIGTLGEIAIVKESDGMFYGQNMFLVRLDKNKIYQRYFVNYFKSDIVKRQLNSKQNKSTQSYLKANHIESLKIPIPDLNEQEEIAYRLDKIQEIIDTKGKQLKELNELIKSQFVEMFGDPFFNDKKWKTNTIGKCCILKSGNSLSAEVENEGGDVLYVKVGDMNLKGNEKYITTSSYKVSEKTAGKGIFELGTVLFPKRGGAIGTNKKRLTNSKVCADLNIMGVTPIKEIISEYLFTYFLFIDLGTLNNGSSVPQINNKDIEPLIIPIPPIELQNQFAYIVKQIDKQKFEIQKSLEEVEKLQESLMNKYFGG